MRDFVDCYLELVVCLVPFVCESVDEYPFYSRFPSLFSSVSGISVGFIFTWWLLSLQKCGLFVAVL